MTKNAKQAHPGARSGAGHTARLRATSAAGAVLLVTSLFAAGAVAACRQEQPAIDPKPQPNSPLPRMQRATDDGTTSKTTTTSESSSKGDGEASDAGR